MHYLYLKKAPKVQAVPINLRYLPLIMILLGFLLIGSVSLPIFSYQFLVSPQFNQKMVRPIPDGEVLGSGSEEDVNDTLLSNWFSNAPKLPPLPSKITNYNLSVPKLKIKDAVVEIGGEHLDQSLVQYEGTAFPGQFGNTVVFGHSVLPQFYNPSSYLTIFSLLPTLKKGDEILVDFDGVTYTYLIEQMVEVKPNDISILEQRYDDSYLSLVTCVPPGTLLKRLVVKARLEKE